MPRSNVRQVSRLVGAIVLTAFTAATLLLAFSLYSHRSALGSVDPLMVVAILLVAAAVAGFGAVVLFLNVLRD